MEDQPLLAALFEEEVRKPLSVSELNADIKQALESRFASVWVEGEISGFMAASSGHWYFKLTDGGSFLKAVCWKGQNYKVRFKPSDGLQVRVRGRITTYEARGEYQLVVESLEPVGEGALAVAFEQIKARLQAEGLFDHALKRKLPPFPRRIGIITSPTGAALHDILTVLKRRARMVSVLLIPAQVQGETAGEQIARAIELTNEYCRGCPDDKKIDVLIVGRGGGSAEDLWAFNEEQVARAIRASAIPVISAVGHEVDFTIADFVSDLRAATPSAAAELVAQAETELRERIDRRSNRLADLINVRFLNSRHELQQLTTSSVFSNFPSRINALQVRVNQDVVRARIANDARLRNAENKFNSVAAKLDALSPLSVLSRGYSITQKPDGRILRDSHQTQAGERLTVRLASGKLDVEVRNVEDA